MTAALEELAEAVRQESGIRIGPPQLPALEAALARAAPDLGDTAVLDTLADPERARGLVDRVVDELTVQETFFLREPGPLRAVDWPALLERARTSGSDRIRVWSAACATGEEPYTLAILATEALGESPPISVLGTDISRNALVVARRARYGGRSLRNLDTTSVDSHFRSEGDGLVLRDHLRALVRFDRHNLARDPAPPGGELPFDLIVCRNVLIYLDSDAVSRALSALQGALRPPGTLLLGSSDRLCVPRAARPSRSRPARRAVAPVARRSRGDSSGRADRGRLAAARDRAVRRLHGRPAPEPPIPGLAEALRDANEGRLAAAIAGANSVVAADPLNAAAYFVRATAELTIGDPGAAVHSLRSALYVEPRFGLAAFKLGRAYDELGDRGSARRAYERALRTLDEHEAPYRDLVESLDVTEIAAACAARIRALAAPASAIPDRR